jgi:hypothetical protein
MAMQQIVVALVVLVAAGYAAWYWMPARWRRALAGRIAGKSQRLADTLGAAPGCSACESCGSCATPGKADDAAAQANGASREVPAQVVRPPERWQPPR